jgi:hypothetical protein
MAFIEVPDYVAKRIKRDYGDAGPRFGTPVGVQYGHWAWRSR